MQAQILIPMANSLCFGLMLSTALVLFLVPTLYSIYAKLTNLDTGEESSDASSETDREASISLVRPSDDPQRPAIAIH